MKQFLIHNSIRVISEPGDHTRYDYIVIFDNINDNIFKFVPFRNYFEFPKQLNYYEVSEINNLTECVNYINRHAIGHQFHSVNPHTMLECINTVKQLYSNLIPISINTL